MSKRKMSWLELLANMKFVNSVMFQAIVETVKNLLLIVGMILIVLFPLALLYCVALLSYLLIH